MCTYFLVCKVLYISYRLVILDSEESLCDLF